MSIGGGIEYEYQIININKNDIIKRLKSFGAKKIHKKIVYSSIYYWSQDKMVFFRIRNELNNTTITKKILRPNKMALEYEIDIKKGSSFEEIDNFVKNIIPSNYDKVSTEKLREKWELKNLCHEIVFDTWPGLEEYMEIDCNSKKDLDKILKLLNLTNNKKFIGGAFDYYMDFYGIENRAVLKILSLEFRNIDKVLSKYIKKNKNLIKNIKNKQIRQLNIK
jgi:hypothetical protein